MRIFFIRHGQTTGDMEDRYGGDYDDHLTVAGLKQAADLALELQDKGIELVVASPLLRAQESATVLSESLHVPLVIEPNFRERNQYGILTGRIKSETRREFPELAQALSDWRNTIAGAESYEDFSQRVRQALSVLLASTKFSVLAIVWHGGTMRTLFRDILKKGELKKDIGDCGWVDMEVTEGDFKIMDYRRIEFDF